ncbi:hypothetical protein SAMN05216464_11196 [Mucilaginibacter pineti]|uniref:Uncharacterized protein n=1 Tax=Mucilaginibacter pineti TaxID=1391627 RepID=A0A1G7H7Y4_9SPHI|nr:hypothetical protein [Mucilaginibacter pineti]SDE96384.1 hypothetical protein SAMN05216464_11196 [Mucilaginibacter pineti]
MVRLIKNNSSRSLGLLFLLLFCNACNSGDSHKTIGNSQDTTRVDRAGGPPIRDTATINKDRRDSAKITSDDSTSKGNVDPSGHASKPPEK